MCRAVRLAEGGGANGEEGEAGGKGAGSCRAVEVRWVGRKGCGQGGEVEDHRVLIRYRLSDVSGVVWEALTM